jgi:hypothetical protein
MPSSTTSPFRVTGGHKLTAGIEGKTHGISSVVADTGAREPLMVIGWRE